MTAWSEHYLAKQSSKWTDGVGGAYELDKHHKSSFSLHNTGNTLQ